MRVAGIGFRAQATVASLADALTRAGGNVALIATAEDKVGAVQLRALAAGLALPLVGVGPATLATQVTLTRSERVQERFGAGSLAEAAALAAAGPGARLLGPRVISGDGLATCAIAERNG